MKKITELKKLVKSFSCFIELTKQGYFFSDNTHKDGKVKWGFIRFNYEKKFKEKEIKEYAILDIDFKRDNISSGINLQDAFFFSCVHTYKTIFRIDAFNDGEVFASRYYEE